MARRWVALLVVAGCTEKSRSTDTMSTSLSTAKERVAFLCAYALCPSPAQDTVFHVVFHDDSGGFLPGPSDATIHAVVAVEPDALERWSRGCTPAPVPATPPWLARLVEKLPRFRPTSAPDGYRCGDERRAIHVKDGLVVRTIETK